MPISGQYQQSEAESIEIRVVRVPSAVNDVYSHSFCLRRPLDKEMRSL